MPTEGGVIELTFRAKLDQLDKDMATARAKATKGAEDMGDEIAAKVGNKLSGVITPTRLIAGGAAVGAAGAVLTKLADEGKQAAAQLQTAIENAGGSYDQLAPRIANVSDKLIGLGIDDEATARSLALLTTATQDPVKALDSMGLAADIAAAKHISLEAASEMLAKGYNGNAKVFKQFGITLEANATSEQKAAAMTELARRVNGQAAAEADTFGNKLDVLRIRAENFGEAIGAKVGPALTVMGPVMAGVGGIAQSGLVPALISSTSGFFAMAAGAWAAVLPFLPIILAVGALIAIGVLLWKNWDTVLAVGKTVFGWLKDGAGAALGFLKDNFLYLLGPIGMVIKHWDTLKEAAGKALGWVTDKLGAFLGFVTGIPERIGGALRGSFDGLIGAFKGAWNWVASRINGISFSIPSWVPIVGGKTFDLPNLPILDDGGIVSRPTLALLAANSRPEAVVPLDRMGSYGGDGDAGGGLTIIVQGSLVTERQLAGMSRGEFANIGRHNSGPGF